MRTKTPWDDEYTLLCERCGYVIEGLDPAGNCPECGKPIVESLPERRVGTPWQQSPGVVSLVRTWWMTLRHPLRTLDVMRIDRSYPEIWWLRAFTWLTTACVAFASILISTGMILSTGIKNEGWPLEALRYSFVGFLVVIHLIVVLTFIEQFGIAFLGNRHGLRISRDTASAICSHGAIGWLLAAGTGGLLLIVLSYFESIPNRQLDSMWYFIPVAGAIPGFLFFETFAWLGLRRCRFANRDRA